MIQATQRHEHPGLDIRSHKEDALVLDDLFEIRVEVFQNEIQILFMREHVNKL